MGIQNLVGQTLGQYELRALIGMGGMGAVYRGYQANLRREVAVKVLAAQLVQQPLQRGDHLVLVLAGGGQWIVDSG